FPAHELVAIITGSAVDLRKEFVVTGQMPLRAQLRIDSMEVYAYAEAEPPHRINRLFAFPVGARITDSRIARPGPARIDDSRLQVPRARDIDPDHRRRGA